MPRRIVVVLEGESLVNDASGLVLYKLAVAAGDDRHLLLRRREYRSSPLVSLGGVAIGVAGGFIFIQLHRLIGDAFTEVLVSLSIPYTLYVLAESFHFSGVLAVVAPGIFRARYTPVIVSAEMRILARSVWNILGGSVHELDDLHPHRHGALRASSAGCTAFSARPARDRRRACVTMWRSWCASPGSIPRPSCRAG
jgi:CPA1 family monovalent cation:H+ antiporter